MERHEPDLYDRGLTADLAMLKRLRASRRRVLRLGVAGIGLLLAGGKAIFAQASDTPAARC